MREKSRLFRKKTNLDESLLEEIKEFGFCHLGEHIVDEIGQEIKIYVYEFKSRTYLIKYVGDSCVMFDDITAGK